MKPPPFSPRPAVRELAKLLASVAIVFLSGVFAYLLRFDFQIPPSRLASAQAALALWLFLQPVALRLSGWSRVGWSCVSLLDLQFLVRSVLIAALVSTTAILVTLGSGVPRSIFILQAALLLSFSIAARILVRLALERRDRAATASIPLRRALIYGGGSAGQALLRELRRKPQTGYLPVGFIDDNPGLERQIILGLPVLGPGASLCSLVARHRIDEILIALPSATDETLARIVTLCDQAGRPCKSIPGIAELIRAPERLVELRQIDLEQLLGRPPIQLDTSSISQRIRERVVLVTGAAGSIGSEICRQVSRFAPAHIVALDIAETPLFELENEFESRQSYCPVSFVIGDIRDQQAILQLMLAHRVDIVFHAAAYKHVPLMERHIPAAVANNVFGTLAVANAAQEAAVRDFVMISTDKAVRPTSVMGATKRIAELIVKSRSNGKPHPSTKFVSVRFGNVLGSNGSVVPIFNRQIRSGGPVTVTHPEMRRYFMTIPEASQLVLQAMALGTSDEIFVLDMGSPVLIDQLARSLIALHGKIPGSEIPLQYTGLRPGEKLFEELYLGDENLTRTVHDKILVLKGEAVSRADMDARLFVLRQRLHHNPNSLRHALRELVPEYVPPARDTAADDLRELDPAEVA